MKRTRIAALAAGFLLSFGCGGGSNNNTTSMNVTPHAVGDVVTVQLSNFCEAMPPENCGGEFGFMVDMNGNFTAGPSPSGTKITGTLTPDEFAAFKSSLSPVVQSNVLVCTSMMPVVAGGENVQVMFSDGTMGVVTETDVDKICFRGGQSMSKPFRDELDQLLVKYYPRPFPS